MSAIISLKEVKKNYGLETALAGVSVSVEEGEFMVIQGHSGSGKTTLLNCIAGLDCPDEGSLVVDGIDLMHAKGRELFRFRRERIGLVFQSFNLMPELTAEENVSLFSSDQKAREALQAVGLEDKGKKYPCQLSGGQQQRVSIARALAKDSRIILADEPTGALDYESGRMVLRVLLDIVRKTGKTLVLVTHTQEIGCLANHVLTLKNGRVEKEYYNQQPKTIDEISW